MNLDEAVRLTEILAGLAFAQQSIEHLVAFNKERLIFFPRLLLSLTLVSGFYTAGVTLLLFLSSLVMLQRFQGPYNGGADRMGLLILSCLCLTQITPDLLWREIAFGYLALQLVLSYFISGWVKVINPDWRNGRALRDVFQFSVYPASESLRQLALSPRLLLFLSWYVILFELLFPLSLFSKTSLLVALFITGSFHFSNACLFGLNRFFWIWIAAYPSILWFQQRIFATL
jgi:hypothetical protein